MLERPMMLIFELDRGDQARPLRHQSVVHRYPLPPLPRLYRRIESAFVTIYEMHFNMVRSYRDLGSCSTCLYR